MLDGHAYQELWDDLQDVLARHFIDKRVKYSPHAMKRMIQRYITEDTIRYVVLNNTPDELFLPKTYPYGESAYTNENHVFSIAGRDRNGRHITVGMYFKNMKTHLRFVISTVFETGEFSRHKHH